jgi:hypothetical protein
VLILDVNQNKALEVLKYLLEQQYGEPETEQRDNITYTFFTTDNSHYTLINDDGKYQSIGIMGGENSYVVNLQSLVLGQSLNSQLIWDLLEQGGIKQYSFQLLYKGKIPNHNRMNMEDLDI